MRDIIVSAFLTLDGVMPAPGGSEEDTSDNFDQAGWNFFCSQFEFNIEIIRNIIFDI